MKNKIFSLVGFILGCIAVVTGIVGIVFSILCFVGSKKIKPVKPF